MLHPRPFFRQRFFQGFLLLRVGLSRLRTRNPRAVAHALQSVPPASGVHRTLQPLVHPLGHVRATPPPTIRWRVLENFHQLVLLLSRQHRSAHINLMAMISDARFSLSIPSLDDRACVTKQFGDFSWRFSLLDVPQNMPMGPFHRVRRLSITFTKLFCCQLRLHLHSFYYISSYTLLERISYDARTSTMLDLSIYPVESINLTQCKTAQRKGGTLKTALVAGRYDEQETICTHVREGLRLQDVGSLGDSGEDDATMYKQLATRSRLRCCPSW